MNLTLFLVKYLGTALVAGVLGGLAMEWVMWLISRAGLAKGDMILALGSLLTKSRDNAYRVGLIVHVTAAVGFALVYTLLMVTLGYTHLPMSLMLGLDGQLCGWLNVTFADVEAKVLAGATDAEAAEWIFSTGLRPNRMQAHVWNEHSRKLGWNDRVSAYLASVRTEPEWAHITATTSFDIIEQSEGREPPAMKG